MRMRIASVAVLIVLSALVLSALSGQATTNGECLLLEAREKLDVATLADAIQKTRDYQSRVPAVSFRGNLALDDATVLSAGDDVIACIGAIGQ
jgi:hypothetical protein